MTRNASGVYTEYILASNTTGLAFLPSLAARLSVTDISVQEYVMHTLLFAKSSGGSLTLEGIYD